MALFLPLAVEEGAEAVEVEVTGFEATLLLLLNGRDGVKRSGSGCRIARSDTNPPSSSDDCFYLDRLVGSTAILPCL